VAYLPGARDRVLVPFVAVIMHFEADGSPV
jgi:hypothetical protein